MKEILGAIVWFKIRYAILKKLPIYTVVSSSLVNHSSIEEIKKPYFLANNTACV